MMPPAPTSTNWRVAVPAAKALVAQQASRTTVHLGIQFRIRSSSEAVTRFLPRQTLRADPTLWCGETRAGDNTNARYLPFLSASKQKPYSTFIRKRLG